MEDFPIDESRFHIVGPLYVLLARVPLAPGAGVSIIQLDTKHGPCVPLFTDADLAERFNERVDGASAGVSVGRLATPAAIIRFLGQMEGQGYSLVAFDPSGEANAEFGTAPVARLRAALEKVMRGEEGT
jgi:hypothetical protein